MKERQFSCGPRGLSSLEQLPLGAIIIMSLEKLLKITQNKEGSGDPSRRAVQMDDLGIQVYNSQWLLVIIL